MAEPAELQEPSLESLVDAIAAKGDLPSAARVIQRLHDAVRKENCNALDVARIILADPGLSSKVLRIVNSSFYRPRGEPVSTITRAVILLGFAAIRDLTTGVVLMDEIARRAGGRIGIRDVLRQSLLCGSLSRAVSTAIGYPNPEEAYLMGLFANWGELCLATYYPERYEQALARAHDEDATRERALAEVFGVPTAELATAMLARWSFPPNYADYFRAAHPAGDRPVTTNAQKLMAVVDLANRYAAQAQDLDPEAPLDADLARSYEAMFGRPAEGLRTAVQQAVEDLREHGPVLRIAGIAQSARHATPMRPQPTPAHTAPAAVEAPLPAPAPRELAAFTSPTTQAFEILAEITRAILAQDNINDTLAMVLEGIARTGGFDVAFLALLNGRKDHLIGRLGYGDGVAEYLHQLNLPLSPDAGALAESVLTREVRVVTAGTGAMLVSRGAPPATIPAASFVAHPLVVRGRAIGVMVVARGSSGPVVGASDLTLVQLFCNQAGIVLDRAVG